jgi:hypothetical protein
MINGKHVFNADTMIEHNSFLGAIELLHGIMPLIFMKYERFVYIGGVQLNSGLKPLGKNTVSCKIINSIPHRKRIIRWTKYE